MQEAAVVETCEIGTCEIGRFQQGGKKQLWKAKEFVQYVLLRTVDNLNKAECSVEALEGGTELRPPKTLPDSASLAANSQAGDRPDRFASRSDSAPRELITRLNDRDPQSGTGYSFVQSFVLKMRPQSTT